MSMSVTWSGRPWVNWQDPNVLTPDEGDRVLCCTRTKKGVLNYVIGYYIFETKTWVCGMNSNVIAWCRLPDLPKEDQL